MIVPESKNSAYGKAPEMGDGLKSQRAWDINLGGTSGIPSHRVDTIWPPC